jgi:UDP-N-acetylglucosamine acyltransferase
MNQEEIKQWAKLGVTVSSLAVIYPGVKIGEGCYIDDFAVIGDPAQIKDGFTNMPVGKVVIGRNTHIGAHCHISSGSEFNTVIGDHCFIMGRVHIGHDCVIGHDVVLSEGAILSGHVEIGDKANVGIGATFHQFVKIPEKCMIGMAAVVTKKAAASMGKMETWAGNPAKKLGINKKWQK